MKKLTFALLCSLLTTQVLGYDFKDEDSGLYFNITSNTEPYTVEVTYENIDNDYASNYSGLSTATIPETVAYSGKTYSVTNIGSSAFRGCSGLISVTIPNSVINIGLYAFRDCNGLTSVTIPNSVTNIGKYAFFGCSGLTSISIPNSVTSIEGGAFSGCSDLTKVNIESIESWIGITFGDDDSNPLFYAHHLYEGDKEVTELVIPNSVTSIGKYAFSGCRRLSSVSIPNSVKNIGSYAFRDCSGLTKVNVESIEGWLGITFGDNDSNPLYYAHHLYEGDKEVTELVIPNSVTSIGKYAFSGCRSLTSVSIPNSVKNIGSYAFRGCSDLTKVNIESIESWIGITFGDDDSNPLFYAHHLYEGDKEVTELVIPNSVTSIGKYAFSGCSGLASVTIPNSVTSIGSSAFSDCRGLTSVTISNSVTNIGDFAFLGCSGLTSVAIPNSVTSIGKSAFAYCSGLTSVNIPNSVTSIGLSAFYKCSGLEKVNAESIEGWLGITFKDCSSNPLCCAQHLYVGDKEVTELVVPNSVTSIGDYAFYWCTGLTSVTIPNSVTSIGYDAFRNIKNIVYKGTATGSPWGAVTMNGTIDGDFVYADAEKTQLIAYIGQVGHIIIPNSVTSIGSDAFEGCSGLTSVFIPNSVTEIGWNAFEGCSGLTTIIIPNSVTSIGSFVFDDCDNLTIYCEASSKPDDWSDWWNPDDRPVVWGYVDVDEKLVSNVSIYATSNTIVVENATADIYVYDTMGRLVARRGVYEGSTQIAMPHEGIYIVKCGGDVKRIYLGFRN